MGRKPAHDPDYSGRLIRIPMDFYEIISRITQIIPEEQWRSTKKGYYGRCLTKVKSNPLVILDLDMDIVS